MPLPLIDVVEGKEEESGCCCGGTLLVVEALAQACGILGFKTVNKLPADGYVYYLVGSDNVRFKRPVMPGDKLELRAEVERAKRGIWKFKCRATVEGELACEADIICAERKIA